MPSEAYFVVYEQSAVKNSFSTLKTTNWKALLMINLFLLRTRTATPMSVTHCKLQTFISRWPMQFTFFTVDIEVFMLATTC